MLEPWTCHCGQSNLGAGPCSACLNAAPADVRGAVPPPPAAPHHGRAFLATAVAAVVLLVAGAVSALVVAGRDLDAPVAADGGDGAAGAADEGGTGPGGEGTVPEGAGLTVEGRVDARPGPDASELERLVPELMRFVQDRRGLPFKEPVRVTALDDGAFRDRLEDAEGAEETAEEREEVRTSQRVLEALGLLEKGVDTEEAIGSLRGAAVVGLYDIEADELFLRGTDVSPSVRVTLVHELVHALQDQHFDLGRTDLSDRDDESAVGFLTVVEGDAERIADLYLASLSNREQKEAERKQMEVAGAIDPDIPRVLILGIAFPYLVGPDFVRAVVGAGGQARLDEAFTTPPVSTEQLLHPDAFLRREPIAPVTAPKADGATIADGIIGEFDLRLVLDELGAPGARAAADGWGGDRYVAWRDGDDTCVRVTVAMDTLQDDAELRRALDDIAAERDDFEVEGKGPITFTSCG